MRCALCNANQPLVDSLCSRCVDVVEAYLDSQYGPDSSVEWEKDSEIPQDPDLSEDLSEDCHTDSDLSDTDLQGALAGGSLVLPSPLVVHVVPSVLDAEEKHSKDDA